MGAYLEKFWKIALSWLIVELISLGKLLVRNVGQEFFDQVKALLVQAEEEWNKEGQGEIRRDWLIAQAQTWIDGQTSWGWAKKLIFRSAVAAIATGVINTLNTALGHNWYNAVDQWEIKFDALIGNVFVNIESVKPPVAEITE
jgi:hypothetical protein